MPQISSIRSSLAVGVNESYALGTVQNLDSGQVQSPVHIAKINIMIFSHIMIFNKYLEIRASILCITVSK